jgi:hypothetical protein
LPWWRRSNSYCSAATSPCDGRCAPGSRSTLERGVRMVDEDVDDGFKRCRHPSEFAVPDRWALVTDDAVQDLDDLATERESGHALLDLAGMASAIPSCPPEEPNLNVLFEHFKKAKFPTGHNRPLDEAELSSDWYALERVTTGKWTLVHEADGMFSTAAVSDLRERCKLRMREAALNRTKQYTPAPGVVAHRDEDYLFAKMVTGGNSRSTGTDLINLSAPNMSQLVVSLHESARRAGAGAKRLESGVPLGHWTRFIPHREYDGHWGRAHTYDTWDQAEGELRRWARLPVGAYLPLLAVRGAVASCEAGEFASDAFHAIKIRTIASAAGTSGDATVDVFCPMFVVRGGDDKYAPTLDWRVTHQDLKKARVTLLRRQG